jgi:DNA ligase-1
METSHGYLDGKMQVNQKSISQGKNIGKRNETTPYQQACSEARAIWIKKKESGYKEADSEEVAAEAASEPSKGRSSDDNVPSPMLAHDYHKRGNSAIFPCYTQPKLDGTRCLAISQKGLFSRMRKPFPAVLDHITNEVNRLPPTIILDGELYSKTLTFQEIVGAVKKAKGGDPVKQQQIQLYVYDLVDMERPFESRLKTLQTLFARNRFQHLVLVPTKRCESELQMKEQHAAHVEDGYEGIMLRTIGGDYKQSRSVHLLKYKEFIDDEYDVIGAEQGQGLEEGCVIWVCQTEDGKRFHCRPRGSREDRMEQFQNSDAYIGKKLTVRMQELTDDGIPRFPVGIAFRDYE